MQITEIQKVILTVEDANCETEVMFNELLSNVCSLNCYKIKSIISSNYFQMKYKKGKKDASSSLYSTLPQTLETLHAKEASEVRSEVKL